MVKVAERQIKQTTGTKSEFVEDRRSWNWPDWVPRSSSSPTRGCIQGIGDAPGDAMDTDTQDLGKIQEMVEEKRVEGVKKEDQKRQGSKAGTSEGDKKGESRGAGG